MDDMKITYAVGADGTRTATLPPESLAYASAFLHDTALGSTAEIAAAIQQGHDAVIRNIAGLSDEQAAHVSAPGEWSILDTMAHIVTVKQICVALSSSLANGQLPPGFGPALENETAQDGVTVVRFTTIVEARAAAESAHGALLATVARLDEASLEMRFSHFFFGSLNAREWACFQRIHDGDHFPQLSRLREAAGFPAT